MGMTAYPLNADSYKLAATLNLLAANNLHVSPQAGAKQSAAEKSSVQSNSTELGDDALAEINKLKARDAQVRKHEQAHLAASAGLAVSDASFSSQKGPDGVYYAVSGEVRIDTSRGRTPEETLVKADLIRQAALAPVDPSAVDRGVAAQAQQMAVQAQAEMLQQEIYKNTHQTEQQQNITQAYGNNSPAKNNIDTFA